MLRGSCFCFGPRPLTHFQTSSDSLCFPLRWLFTHVMPRVDRVNQNLLANLDLRTMSIQRLVLCLEQKNFEGKYNYGKSLGTDHTVETSCCRNCSCYFTLSKLQSSLSFILSTSLPCSLEGETESQGLEVC